MINRRFAPSQTNSLGNPMLRNYIGTDFAGNISIKSNREHSCLRRVTGINNLKIKGRSFDPGSDP